MHHRRVRRPIIPSLGTHVSVASKPKEESPEAEIKSITITNSTLNIIPNDVLRLIFAHFYEKPRILVISSVCKRWRDIIRGMIRHHHQKLSVALLAHLPSVSSLVVAYRSTLEQLTPSSLSTLTHVSLLHHGSNGSLCTCKLLSTLAPLSSVCIDFSIDCIAPATSFARQLSSITKLEFGSLRMRDPDQLGQLFLPQLCSLRITASLPPSTEMAFICRYASQLVHLDAKLSPAQGIEFPRLTSLKASTCAWLASTINGPCFPKLRRIKLSTTSPSTFPTLLPFVSVVDLFKSELTINLRLATQLKHLKLATHHFFASSIFPIASQLRSLVFQHSNDEQLLLKCTSLTRLTLHGGTRLLPFSFRHLRMLRWESINDAPERLFKFPALFAKSLKGFAPRLQHLELSFAMDSNRFSSWIPLLSELEAVGIELVRVDEQLSANDIAKLSKFNWMRVIRRI